MQISRSKVFWASGVNIFGQIAQVAIQLATVAVLLRSGGSGLFGQWVVLSTTIAFAVLSDIGLTAFGTARMSAELGAGRPMMAATTLMQINATVIPICTITSFAISTAFFSFPIQNLFGIDRLLRGNVLLPFILACHTVATVQMSIIDSAFRADRKQALSEFIIILVRLLDAVALLTAFHCFHDYELSAAAMLATRLLGLLIQIKTATGHVSFFTMQFKWGHKDSLKEAVKHSLGNFCLALYQASWIYVPVLVLSSVVGGNSVATFSAYRTLARVPLQMTNLVTRALSPELSRIHATMSEWQLRRFLKRMMWFALFASFFGEIAMLLVAPIFIPYWTHAALTYEPLVFLAIAAAMLASSAALPFYYFFVAIQRSALLSKAALLAGSLGAGLELLFGKVYGISGVAVALGAMEVLMIVNALLNVSSSKALATPPSIGR